MVISMKDLHRWLCCVPGQKVFEFAYRTVAFKQSEIRFRFHIIIHYYLLKLRQFVYNNHNSGGKTSVNDKMRNVCLIQPVSYSHLRAHET